MKECIACAEEIKEQARLCKHCGTRQDSKEFLEADQLATRQAKGKFKVFIRAKSEIFGDDVDRFRWPGDNWDEVSEKDAREFILDEDVSAYPVFQCSDRKNEDFCDSGIFVVPHDLEVEAPSSGWLELEELSMVIDDDSSKYFSALLRLVCEFAIEVQADSEDEAKLIAQENLSRCFQIDYLAGDLFPIEVVQTLPSQKSFR